MNAIQDVFQEAELAEAAYANFIGIDGTVVTVESDEIKALTDEGMSESQATSFVDKWRVVDQSPRPAGIFGNGFSATLFERLNANQEPTGEYTLAIAGSDSPIDFAAADFSLAAGGVGYDQLEALINYVLRLQAGSTGSAHQVEFARLATAPSLTTNSVSGVGPGVNPAGLTITGHSLGAFLAQMYQRIFGSASVYTYNALGVVRPDAPIFAQLTGLLGLPAGTFSSGAGVNLVVPGEPARLVGTVQGKTQVPIFSENAIDGSLDSRIGLHIAPHYMKPVTDALALYELLATLGAGTDGDLPDVSSILKASSNHSNHSLETALDALRNLFDRPTISRPTITSDREDYYSNLDMLYVDLQTSFLNIGTDALPQYSFALRDLTISTAAQILFVAQDNIAYRYALKELNPFAIEGDDTLYQQHNQNGELDVYSAQTLSGQLTKEWLEDRTAFLAWKNLAYARDTNLVAQPGAQALEFRDLALGLEVYVTGVSDDASTVPMTARRFIFGGDGAEQVRGGSLSDRLYGGGGDDEILGGADTDYLEGDAGIDHLYGGTGNDLIVGGLDNDFLIGGADNDALYGGAGFDTYLFHVSETTVDYYTGVETTPGDGNDVIFDYVNDGFGGDGKGVIEVGGHVVGAGSIRLSDTIRQNADGRITYTKHDSDLVLSFSDAYGANTTDSITIKNFDFDNGALGITVSKGPKLVVAPGTKNLFSGNPDYAPADLTADIREGAAKLFTIGVSEVSNVARLIKLSLSGGAAALKWIYDGVIPDAAGADEITVWLPAGHDSIQVALAAGTDISADQSGQLTATLLNADGSPLGHSVIDAITLNVDGDEHTPSPLPVHTGTPSEIANSFNPQLHPIIGSGSEIAPSLITVAGGGAIEIHGGGIVHAGGGDNYIHNTNGVADWNLWRRRPRCHRHRWRQRFSLRRFGRRRATKRRRRRCARRQ